LPMKVTLISHSSILDLVPFCPLPVDRAKAGAQLQYIEND
jgi:hypothetical protein